GVEPAAEVAGLDPSPGRLRLDDLRAVAADGELAGLEQPAARLLQIRLRLQRGGVAERGSLVAAEQLEVLPLVVELVGALAAGEQHEDEREQRGEAEGGHRGGSEWNGSSGTPRSTTVPSRAAGEDELGGAHRAEVVACGEHFLLL